MASIEHQSEAVEANKVRVIPPMASESNASAREPSLRQRAVRASAWWVIVSVIKKSINLGANIILAALLSPAIFGVMALADVVHRGVRMFSDIGIRPAIIQNRRDDPTFLNTAWTIQVFRGVMVWIVASLMAWPMAWFYGEPILLGLVPVVAFGSVLGGFESTSLATLNRQMREKPRALLSLAETVLKRGSMIVFALLWPSAWALAAGTIIAGLFMTTASHTIIPGITNRFTWDEETGRALISFGKWIFIGSIIAFFANEVDKLVLGKMMMEHMDAIGLLGVYVIAKRFAGLPGELMGPLVGQMALPVMSELVRQDQRSFGPRVKRFRGIVLWPSMILCLAVGILAPGFFGVMYDDRYAAATWMAPLIVLGVWIDQLNQYAHNAVLSLGKPKALTFGSIVKLVVSLIGGLSGFCVFGVPGFIVGMMCGTVAMHVFVLTKLRGYGVNLFWQDAGMTGLFLALAGAGHASVWLGACLDASAATVVLTWVVPLALWTAAAVWATSVVVPEVWRGR